MFFDTPVYLIFLTLICLLYWCLNRKKQNVLLLAASYFFYGWWDWRFLSLMLISTLVDFTLGIIIADTSNRRLRRTLLVVSLVMNLGFLAVFKYCNFFVDSFIDGMRILGFHDISPVLIKIILPPGISFYTFQAVAYIIDV